MQAKRILSLDDGGIRGLVTCRWLKGAEDALLAAGQPGLMKSIDLYAGGSTGAIVASGLAIGLSPDIIAQMYREHRHPLFPGMANRLWSRATRLFTDGPSAPRYDGKGLEKVLKRVFGDIRLGQVKVPLLVT